MSTADEIEQQQKNKGEQQFGILPHPHSNGHVNFPGSKAEETPGLGGAPTLGDLHASAPNAALGGRGAGPHVPSDEVASKLEQPKSREELQALQASLNE